MTAAILAGRRWQRETRLINHCHIPGTVWPQLSHTREAAVANFGKGGLRCSVSFSFPIYVHYERTRIGVGNTRARERGDEIEEFVDCVLLAFLSTI